MAVHFETPAGRAEARLKRAALSKLHHLDGQAAHRRDDRTRHMARRRSLVVLASFTTATLVALVALRLGRSSCTMRDFSESP